MQNSADCYLRKRVHVVVADKLKIVLNHGSKSLSLKKCVCVCAWGWGKATEIIDGLILLW